jgi:anaerobic selenocysteine-containing dehydrogenase
MKPRTVKSYCRICVGSCGVELTLDEHQHVARIRGDQDHPLSKGYACIKGVNADLDNREARLLHPLKRKPDGTFERITVDQAITEISEKLGEIVASNGPDSVASYRGTADYFNAVAYQMLPAWMNALGSRSFFTSRTIDQSAKIVAQGRIGRWAAGYNYIHDSDVWLIVGGNPLISHSFALGYHPCGPVNELKEAKERGLKLIVIDPRETETARLADVFLQIRPGQDPFVAAGLLRIILDEGWEDKAFCAAHVRYVDELRSALAPFDPHIVAERAGVKEGQLRLAAATFAQAAKGIAKTGTGPDMAPRSNLAEHLYECLNVICGRYMKAGEEVKLRQVLTHPAPVRAEVVGPAREWENSRKSRVGGYGTLYGGEMLTGALADEILSPGEGQIRALFNCTGNPVSAMPDVNKTIRAFQSLDLLVTFDPFMTATSNLAHYILPGPTQYERPDLAAGAFPAPYRKPFVHYVPAAAQPPEGHALVDEWLVFWKLAQLQGLQIVYDGIPLDMEQAPTCDELLSIIARNSQVPLKEIKRHPSGLICDLERQFVEAGRPEANAKLEVAPPDIVAELHELAEELKAPKHDGYVLTVRRMRDVMNSSYHGLSVVRRRQTSNPAYMNPADMVKLGLRKGDAIEITSDNDSILAVVEADPTVRAGVVSMSHAWGGLVPGQGDFRDIGSCTNLLISSERDIEAINAMPRASAIPVDIRRVDPEAEKQLLNITAV